MIGQILKNMVVTFGVAAAFSAAAFGQAFTSGSTGADGAYLADTSGDFDPNNLKGTCSTCTANNVVNAAGDNVFNFTTITVNSGVTVRIRASKVRNLSVVWLATGNVAINGTLNLSGDSGYTLNATDPSDARPVPPARRTRGRWILWRARRSRTAWDLKSGPGTRRRSGGAERRQSEPLQPPVLRGRRSSLYSRGSRHLNRIAPFSGTIMEPRWPGSSHTANIYLVPLYGGSGGGGGWGTNLQGRTLAAAAAQAVEQSASSARLRSPSPGAASTAGRWNNAAS